MIERRKFVFLPAWVGGVYILSVILFSHYVWGTVISKIVAAFFCAFYFIFQLLTKRRIIRVMSCHILFVSWLMVGLLSGVLVTGSLGTIKNAITVGEILFLSILLFNLFCDEKSRVYLFLFFIFSSILSFLLVKCRLFDPPYYGYLYNQSLTRFEGTLGNANLFGYVSLMAIVFVPILWIRWRSHLVRITLLVISLLLMYQIILSGSRKALIGLVIFYIIFYILFLLTKKDCSFRKTICVTIFIIFALGFLGSLFLGSSQSYRMRNIVHFFRGEQLEGGEQSIYGRWKLIKIGFQEYMKHPVFGIGIANFSHIKNEKRGYKSVGTYSHSNFIEILVSTGIVGFIFYYGMYVIIFFKIGRVLLKKRNEVDFCLLLFLVSSSVISIIYEAFSVLYYTKEFWIVFSAILGLLYSLERDKVVA